MLLCPQLLNYVNTFFSFYHNIEFNEMLSKYIRFLLLIGSSLWINFGKDTHCVQFFKLSIPFILVFLNVKGLLIVYCCKFLSYLWFHLVPLHTKGIIDIVYTIMTRQSMLHFKFNTEYSHWLCLSLWVVNQYYHCTKTRSRTVFLYVESGVQMDPTVQE